MNYKIRKSINGDTNTLLAMSRRITNKNNREFLPDEKVDAFLESEFFESEVTDYVGEIDVLLFDEDIIGMCRFDKNTLESLMIDCDYQGTGAASYFLNQLLNKKFGQYNEIKLECFQANKRARRFYEKQGFILDKIYLDSDLNEKMCVYTKSI